MNEAICAYEDAVRDDPENAIYLKDLGMALHHRFQQLGDIMDINKAVVIYRDAVRLTPDSHPDKAYRLMDLGNCLIDHFKRCNDLQDLDEAIKKHEDAVCLIPDHDSDRPAMLTRLGFQLVARFNRLGNLDDLCHGISRQEDAVALTPDGDPNKPSILMNLGIALHTRFRRLGKPVDINRAALILKDAVDLTPDGHPARPVMVHTLGTCLQTHFQQSGNLRNLNECISRLKEAVHLTADGHPHMPIMLNNLGGALKSRFDLLGDLSDLEESISMMKDAVQLTPDGYPDKPDRLNNLGGSLQSRFERFGDRRDINEAVLMREDAVSLTPDDHPDKPGKLNNLGTSLQIRFKRFGDIGDLNKCISIMEDAVELTPDGHSTKPGIMCMLGTSLLTRFDHTRELDDLEKSISKLEAAVLLAPPGHPEKPILLINYGNALYSRYEQFQNSDDLPKIIDQYASAAQSTTGPADTRFDAASAWASCAEIGQHPSIVEAYDVALNLFSELAWLGLSINDRYQRIVKAGLEVRHAAETAIWSKLCGQPEKAVEWLDQGRSIIWGQILNLRTPVDDLKEKYPLLAEDLINLSRKLEGAGTRETDTRDAGAQESLQSIAQKAHENAQQRDVLVQKIRALDGFRRFLLPKTISELSLAAQDGPVVCLNVGSHKCDALVLIPAVADEVIHVPLPDFSPDHINTLVQSLKLLMPRMGRSGVDRLKGNREGGSVRPEDSFAHILSELWVRLVKPVLNALAITTPKKDNLQRMWWCPSGPTTFLPIHAAGLYGKENVFGSKLSDFVISSYTPSLTALIQAHRPHPQPQPATQMLAVAQPSASGQSKIPATREEINRIQQYAKVPVLPLVQHEATIARVEEAMLQSAWVHFACHGVQDSSNPTQSALLLAGSSQLTLERIIKLSLPHADLAFLSACQTATGDQELQEESVHLAAGMLLAGYRGVIATMWSIMDNDGPQVAGDVYEHLFKTSPPDSTRAAEALHLAIRNLCEGSDQTKSFFDWVPFIHIGV
ncbi:CHAT domain-containing protein [Mycena capillaripes]|nr:CHAT domain-containing protein [Mycena capillaripes]